MTDFTAWINSPGDWIALALCAVLIGMSKTGIQGISTLVVPVLALVFGAKPSTGLLLPMLCIADIIAVVYYRRNAEWRHIWRLLPTALAGFVLALLVDRFIPAVHFKRLMALCILAGIAVMFWSERKGKENVVGNSWWFAPAFGLLGGFTTMIGNAAGPVMAVYLLAMRLPKYSFVGTSAWFFLIVNLMKVPLQIYAWNNITLSSFMLDLAMIPFIAVGAVGGIALVKRLPESKYRTMIIWLTVISTLLLVI